MATPTPHANGGAMSKGTGFILVRFVIASLHQLAHSASAGLILTSALFWVGSRPGETGRQGGALLQQFLDHSLPSKLVYGVALALLGTSMVANRVLGNLVRKWLARPIIEVATHTVAVAVGVILGLTASATYVSDIRPQLSSLGLALVSTLLIYCILQVALWTAKGRFDKLLTSHAWVELSTSLAGLVVALAAASDVNAELQKADQHAAACQVRSDGDGTSPGRKP